MPVNHALLRLVREALGKTQTDVAKTSGIAQGTISKYEKGLQEPSPGQLADLCKALDSFSPSFFEQDVRPSGVMYRSRVLRSVKLETTVRGRMNLIRFAVSRLLDDITVVETTRFPEPDRQYSSPEDAAIALRRSWGIVPGPVQGLADLLEHAGGVVVPADLGTDAVIAAYMNPLGDPRRWFFVNSRIDAGDRVRLSLAHELGHAVMHGATLVPESKEAEQEAYRFGAEFLLPRADLLTEIPKRRLQLTDLYNLKLRFGVSMQAILMAAHRAGVVTESHKITLFKQISARGWRIHEPGEVSVERPFLLDEALRILRDEHGFSEDELERTALVPRSVLADLLPDYFAPARQGLRVL